MKAKKMSYGKSKKLFKRTANKVHPKNNLKKPGLRRGGIRL